MPKKKYSPEIEEIWQLFGQENKESLDVVEDSLLEMEKNPTNDDLIAALFRAIHTYKGGARMMGLSVLESLAHRTEDLASLIREHKIMPEPAVTEVLLKVTDTLRQLLDYVISQRQDVEKSQIEEMIQQLDALIEGQTGPAEAVTAPAAQEINSKTAAETTTHPEIETAAAPAQESPDSMPQEYSEEAIQTAVPSPAEPAFIPTNVLTHDVELINPAMDSQYLDIFLEMAKDELRQIHTHVESLAGGDQDAKQKILASSDSFRYAAERMGYMDLVSALDEMIRTVNSANNDFTFSQAEGFTLLNDQERRIKNLITSLERPASSLESESSPQAETESTHDASEVLRQWRTEKSLAHLSRDELDNLKRSLGEILADYTLLHQTVEHLYGSDMEANLQRILIGQEELLETETDTDTNLQFLEHDLHSLRQVERKIGNALNQIQEQVRSLGLRSAAEILQPLEHMAQDLGSQGGKQVALEIEGSELELDGTLLQSLIYPLNNLVWFSITQGIEMPEERQTAGKSICAKVKVTLKQREDHVVIVVEDDGKGLDLDTIERRARQLGWGDNPTGADEWYQYVLRPGFGSLGPQQGGLNFSDLAERLKTQRGHLSITSKPGEGARFTIRMPIEMAVVDSLVVRVAKIYYILPISAVRRIVWLEKDQLVYSSAEGREAFIRLEDQLIPVRYLKADTDIKNLISCLMIVLVNGEGAPRALVVDELLGQQQAIVYPLLGILAEIKNYSGCALLGNGEIGMIINLDSALFA